MKFDQLQNTSSSDKNIHWRGIIALNAVSTLSQLGQYGVGFIVMPMWLASRHLEAVQLGIFGAFEWLGMLIALLITPKLLKQYTSKEVIFLSLVLSSLGFLFAIFSNWPLWIVSALLIGFGIGLRWIANETWLYRIVPKNILGQIVGVHEALIALGAIIPPALVLMLSTANNNILLLGILFNLLAMLPLLMIASEETIKAPPVQSIVQPKISFFKNVKMTKLGMFLAGACGLVDGALTSLFPVFGSGRDFSEMQIALMLTVIGIGGLALQYPLGWLSDRKGLIRASLLAAFITLFVTSMMAFAPIGYHSLVALSFIFGGMTASFLTFGIIAAASVTDDDHMAENMSKISISFTVCSMFGALIAGFSTGSFGSDALLWLVALVSGVLTCILIKNLKNDF
jgi:MFS family permease